MCSKDKNVAVSEQNIVSQSIWLYHRKIAGVSLSCFCLVVVPSTVWFRMSYRDSGCYTGSPMVSSRPTSAGFPTPSTFTPGGSSTQRQQHCFQFDDLSHHPMTSTPAVNVRHRYHMTGGGFTPPTAQLLVSGVNKGSCWFTNQKIIYQSLKNIWWAAPASFSIAIIMFQIILTVCAATTLAKNNLKWQLKNDRYIRL